MGSGPNSVRDWENIQISFGKRNRIVLDGWGGGWNRRIKWEGEGDRDKEREYRERQLKEGPLEG